MVELEGVMWEGETFCITILKILSARMGCYFLIMGGMKQALLGELRQSGALDYSKFCGLFFDIYLLAIASRCWGVINDRVNN